MAHLLQLNWKRVACLALVIGLALIAGAARVTQAAPAAPNASTLTVNSTADTNTADSVLTLREVLLIARGGTAANGVNRALTTGEKAQLSGCQFSGSTIIGGCGASYADTINFSGIGTYITITLTAELPPIDDTQPTTIDGTGTYPTIDGHFYTNYGFQVASNGNTLQRIGVNGASTTDFRITGDNNTLYDVWAWRAGDGGVTITGNYDTIDGSRIGVNNVLSSAGCGSVSTSPGSGFYGVYITDVAQHATVKNSYLGCNGSGITVASSLSIDNTYHTFGPNNHIGVNATGAGNLGNMNNGVTMDTQNNVVMSNTISYNGGNGVEIAGGYGAWNYLGGNTIRLNSGSGIELSAWAFHNYIGQLSLFGTVVSNTIGGNLGNGILITDTTTPPSFNVIVGNQIGVSADGLTDDGNGGYGILVYGAHDTYIGGSGAQRNIIAGNALDGINLAGGANNSHVVNNLIGVGATGGRIPNSLAGVAVLSGAHDNLIGAPTAGNLIGANQTYGVFIGGSGTNTNTVQMNSIGISGTANLSNTLDGVMIQAGAAANQLLTNTIAFNQYKGVYLTGAGTNRNLLQANTIRLNGSAGVVIDNGASNNYLGLGGARSNGNVISANAADGVYIGDATTSYNVVYGNYIGTNAAGNVADSNGQNGVVLNQGTHHNAIGYVSDDRNVIAGNAWNGVSIINGAHDNSVQSNDIGTNRDFPIAAAQATGPARPAGGSVSYIHLPNGYDGVSIIGAYTNTIGGYVASVQAPNFIHYNTGSGIYLANGSHHNVIGLSEIRGNTLYGVILDGTNTAYNTITRTLIYQNGLDGIGERNNADLNVWTEVGINDNGGLGIDKSASNDALNVVNAPYVFFDSINKVTGAVNGHGHATDGVFNITRVELYRVSPDPGGFGEGGVFLGRTTTDASGNWTITDPSPLAARGCYTAFITEVHPFLLIPNSSSEFSANTCRVFLPTLQR